MQTRFLSEFLKRRDLLGELGVGESIKTDAKDIECEVVDWIHLNQKRVQ
jgi:hypothetical protein